jgi:hypothetical protein
MNVLASPKIWTNFCVSFSESQNVGNNFVAKDNPRCTVHFITSDFTLSENTDIEVIQLGHGFIDQRML